MPIHGYNVYKYDIENVEKVEGDIKSKKSEI